MAYERTSGAGGKYSRYNPTYSGGGGLLGWSQNQREETDKYLQNQTVKNPSTTAAVVPQPVSNPYLDLLNRQRAEQEQRLKNQQAALQQHKEKQIGIAGNRYNEMLSYLDKSYGQGNERLTGEKTNALQGGFVQNEIAKRDMPQINAAMGNTGGLSESALVGQNAAYQTNRNSTEEHYGNLLKDLLMKTDEAKTNAKIGYEDTVANVENQTLDKGFQLDNHYADLLSQMETDYAKQLANIQAKAVESGKKQTPIGEDKTQEALIKQTQSTPLYKRAYNRLVNGGTPKEVGDELMASGIDAADIDLIMIALGL